jgi:aspartokinase/homoserine dehydrogenase 1
MLVLKFGGTSVGSLEAIGKLVDILGDPGHAHKVRVVVVSALSGMTDSLIAAARQAAAGIVDLVALKAMEDRHRKIARAFLARGAGSSPEEAGTESRADVRTADAAIKAVFAELNHILDGISILRELSPRVLDLVMSFGERLSADLIARICTARGIPAEYLDARPLILTDGNFGAARFLPEETYPRIRSYLKKHPALQIATGFIASDGEGYTATLGRGGSNLSAAIFGAAMGAKTVEIWTDVDGILTADPKLVKNAFRIDSLSYHEAMELSHFGAKVLHPPTVRPALEKGIPIWIRNTFNPGGGGTRISDHAESGNYPIRGISSMGNISLVRVQGSGMVGVAGFSSRLFGALARKKISVILITQASSEYSICIALAPQDAEAAAAAIREEFDREINEGAIESPAVMEDLSIIAVVGSNMEHTSGISGKVFHALGRNGINVVAIAQGSSEINISAVISNQDVAKGLNAVHEAFFLAGVRSVNLFLMGTGLIGGTLLEQIAGHKEILADQFKIRINLTGVANSKGMIFNPQGLDSKKVKAILASAASSGGTDSKPLPPGTELFPQNPGEFIRRMKTMNLPNTAFCDCTASNDVSGFYAEILQSAIPIVTPNKRANSGAFEYYKTLTGYSKDRGIPYLYETTVCAGLPVISTLRDLTLSGDKVRRIEAVLSGTLSFIFNNYDGSKPFSALVREAKAKGYTEPDPRDDLNAMDAARKALILARECGLSLEFSGVAIEPILPPSCFKADGVEAFFTELEKADDGFEKRRLEAAKEGKVLRYVAVIEDGSARISLRAEPPGSPFRSLVDSDNIVVITTDRYSSLPMVIKGPGAGAQVTAGGVFADIVRIARTLV